MATKTRETRVHIIDSRGKTRLKKAYTRPGHALRCAQKMTLRPEVREAQVFAGSGRDPALIYYKGEAYSPLPGGDKAAPVSDPREVIDTAHTATQKRDTEPKTTVASRKTGTKRVAEYEAAYLQVLRGERKRHPLAERYGMNSKQAAAARRRVKQQMSSRINGAVETQRAAASTKSTKYTTTVALPEDNNDMSDAVKLLLELRTAEVEAAMNTLNAAQEAYARAANIALEYGVEEA